jgi:Na+/melibiose symporter-like transporter
VCRLRANRFARVTLRVVTEPDDPQRNGDDALSRGTLLAYALPAAPVQFLFMLFLLMYLKFATDDLGVSPAVVGTIFLVARLWDAVSDPLVGNLSDRTHSRLGRRRSWLLAASLPLLVFALMAWSPPSSLSGGALTVWIAVAIVLFYTAYTAFDVPHMALGAEITLDRQSRNRVYGARQISRAIGMLAAAGATGLLISDDFGRGAAFWLMLGAGTLAAGALIYSVFALPPERADHMGRGGQDPFRYALNEAMFPLTVVAGTLSVFLNREGQDGKQEVTGQRGFGPIAQAIGADQGV